MKMSLTLCCDSGVIKVKIVNHEPQGSNIVQIKNLPQKSQEHLEFEFTVI